MKYETGLMDVQKSLNGKAPTTVMNVEKPIKRTYNSHLTVKPLERMNDMAKNLKNKSKMHQEGLKEVVISKFTPNHR